MILPNSRYSNSTVATVEKDGSHVPVIVPSAAVAYSFQYISHAVTLGERVESIAFQYYTDASLWYRIAQANHEILWWDNLAPATIIRVPLI